MAAIRGWFDGLPADRYPNLVRLADHLTDADARFCFGLNVLPDGLTLPLHLAT